MSLGTKNWKRISYQSENGRLMQVTAFARILAVCSALLFVFSHLAQGQTVSSDASASATPTISQIASFASAKAVFESDLAAANQGNPQAQLRVAKAYVNGAGVNPNGVEAFTRFEALAQQGSSEATAWLGTSYVFGFGVARDVERGAALIKQAAGKNDPVGLTFMGLLYQTGTSVPMSLGKAADLYTQAVALNNGNAMDRLGNLYLRGAGVPKNTEKALNLFIDGAARGDSWAELNLAQMKLEALQLPKTQENMAPIVKLLDDSAAQGNSEAAFTIGELYQKGEGVPQSDTKAFLYFQQSAIRGYGPAQHNLGRAFELGLGIPANPVKAFVWYDLAQQQGESASEKPLELLMAKLTAEQLQKAQLAVSRWRAKLHPAN